MHAKARWPQKPRSAAPLDHRGAFEDDKRPMLGREGWVAPHDHRQRTRRKRSARSWQDRVCGPLDA
jgi:hypothetical protein